MPVDPQAAAVLEAFAAIPPFESMEPAACRELMATLRPPVEPEPVGRVEDRTIPGATGAEMPVRIYWPEGAAANLPVFIYYHGGGWVIGDLETMDAPCRAICNQANCVVVSVDYRLAPEHRFPAAADDAYAALLWTAQNAASLGGDASRIAVGGDSAGGNLAAVVSQMARDKGGPAVVFQLLVYPVTDYNLETVSYNENADGYLLTKGAMRWFWGHYLGSEADGANPYASPIRAANLAGLPPAKVITAEYDPLRDEGEAYAAALQKAGVPVTCERFNGMIHGFFGMANAMDQAQRAVNDSASALKQAFNRG
ncbi:MAG: alpha/beta hydrolase [Dehalococcoidia bacterium]|nr:alpha/beta hydrolase [Dehalococcoidia bacterium]